MSVQSNANKNVYQGNGVTRNWPITFPYIQGTAANDIKVYLTQTGGADVLLTSNYTVDAVGGQVVYPTIASGLDPISSAYTITLIRVMDKLQSTTLSNQGAFNSSVIESALDKLTMEVQEIAEGQSRTIQYPVSQTPSSTLTTDFLNTVTALASAASASATAAQGYAAALQGTSTTSLTVGTGTQTITTQASKQFATGQMVLVVDQASSANYMFGTVTSYSGTTLVVSVSATGGSGTKTAWNIFLSGIQGPKGDAGTAGAAIARGTFVNGDLSTGVLTITHNKGLTTPYTALVQIFNNSGVMVIPDQVNTLATNSFKVDLTSYGSLTGTWSYAYAV